MEQPVVSGIMNDKNQAKITIKGVPDQPGIASKFFTGLADENLSVDMIIQNVSDESQTDISFTVAKAEINKASKIVQDLGKLIKARDITTDTNICKISIVGAGMRSHPGVAAKMFSTLSKENINIIMISTSEIRVSCIIEEKYGELAVLVLHKVFDMDKNLVNS